MTEEGYISRILTGTELTLLAAACGMDRICIPGETERLGKTDEDRERALFQLYRKGILSPTVDGSLQADPGTGEILKRMPVSRRILRIDAAGRLPMTAYVGEETVLIAVSEQNPDSLKLRIVQNNELPAVLEEWSALSEDSGSSEVLPRESMRIHAAAAGQEETQQFAVSFYADGSAGLHRYFSDGVHTEYTDRETVWRLLLHEEEIQ